MRKQMREAAKAAVSEAGGDSVVARDLGITRQAVSLWKVRGRVPAEYCRDLERLCEARITRYQLRPDVFGDG